MRPLCYLVLAAVLGAAPVYRMALPGYRYEFPRDHFDHPEFETEWWYYTGNVESAEGRRFGFELTFFRHAVDRPAETSSVWQVDDIWFAHLALSDIGGRRFFHTERMNRAGPGVAGASLPRQRVWNGNWQVQWKGNAQQLQAVAPEFTLQLAMNAVKPPVIHGRNGVSQKASGPGRASHYVSLPRLEVSGLLVLEGETHRVTGTAWMDHEFFTHQLETNQTGWDWFSIQLEDRTELMLFRLRRKDGSADPYSAGTYVDAQGGTRHIEQKEFRLTPLASWTSSATRARYPVAWRVDVPSLGLTLEARTPLKNQELAGVSKLGPVYWEGAMDFVGSKDGSPVRGRGYLEMTGYDKAVTFRPGAR